MTRNDVSTVIYEEPAAREARISRDSDGVPIGAALFFTPEELAEIGVDPETADAVELRIMNGQVCIRPVSQDRDQSDPISRDAN